MQKDKKIKKFVDKEKLFKLVKTDSNTGENELINGVE